MKLHQSGDKIIVTELRPMSELTSDYGMVLIYFNENEKFTANILQVNLFNDGWLTNYNEIDIEKSDERVIGWLPIPEYIPEIKSTT